MTIRELAKIAGVSHATVSRALRNDQCQSAATRERIQALALKHGYTTHPVVSKLMAQLSKVRGVPRSTLALVTDWSQWKQHRFLAEIHQGISHRCEMLGYKVEEFALRDYHGSFSRLSKVLYARGIEGIIVLSLSASSGFALHRMEALRQCFYWLFIAARRYAPCHAEPL